MGAWGNQAPLLKFCPLVNFKLFILVHYFMVLKSLVWFVKEVKSSSLRIGHFLINRKSTVYGVINKTTDISFRKGLN